MAVALRATSSRDTGSASNITVPTGTVADDIIVVDIFTQSSAPTLTGFTSLHNLLLQSGYYHNSFYRVATGSEGGSTVSCSATVFSYVCASYSGGEFDSSAGNRANSGGTISSATVTPSANDCMLVYTCGTWDANGSTQIAAPSGMTRRASVYTDYEPMILADELLSGGSGVGVTRSTTNPYGSGSSWTANLISIKPAATGGTSGSGSPTMARHTGSGSGTTTAPTTTGSGSPSLVRHTPSGAGSTGATGSSATTLARHTAAGSGSTATPSVTGSGSLSLARHTGAGSGSTTGSSTSGSGAPSLVRHTAAGVGSTGATGTSAAALVRHTGAGSGSTGTTGSGAPSLVRHAAAGSGSTTAPGTTGSGSPTCNRHTAAGVGSTGTAGSAGVMLVRYTATGSGTALGPGLGNLILARHTASGSGAVSGGPTGPQIPYNRLQNVQLTGLAPDARRTEILRARESAADAANLTALQAEVDALDARVTANEGHLSGVPTLVQHGTASGTTDVNGRLTVTFPTAFGSAPTVTATPVWNNTSSRNAYVVTVSATQVVLQFVVTSSGAGEAGVSRSIAWIAMGSPA